MQNKCDVIELPEIKATCPACSGKLKYCGGGGTDVNEHPVSCETCGFFGKYMWGNLQIFYGVTGGGGGGSGGVTDRGR